VNIFAGNEILIIVQGKSSFFIIMIPPFLPDLGNLIIITIKIFQGIAKFIDKNLCMASKEPAVMKKGGETVAGKKEIIKLLDKISIQLEGISRYCNHLEMEDIIRKMETISLDDLAKKKTQD
jgi:hypothetical protein